MDLSYMLSEIPSVISSELIPRLAHFSIFTFTGPLGAGKTTIIKELLKQCGVLDVVTSPTFGYVNTYKDQSGRTFNHFDLYRIDSLGAFINAGFDELLSQDKTWSFIEWPEVIQPLLLNYKICRINLIHRPLEKNNRIIQIIP